MKLAPPLLFLFAASPRSFTTALPLAYNVNAGEAECLYDNLKEGEHVTTSLIILDGEELKGRMSLQGPLGKPGTASATEVIAAAMRYDKTKDDRLELYDPHTIDFEELYDEGLDDDDDGMDDYSIDDDIDDLVFRDYYYDFDDDDEYEFYEDDEMDEADRLEMREAKARREAMSTEEKQLMKKERQAARMKEMEAMMKKRNEGRKQREKNRKMQASDKPTQHEMMMDRLLDGGSFEKTVQIQEAGWYRFCVLATDSDIEMEFEMRKSSDVGKPNKETGHLQSYERRDMMLKEKKLFAQMDREQEGVDGIKKEELDKTKEQITKLNRLLNDIREHQSHERHRLAVHAAINAHSHSRMVLNSLFETFMYIAVSGFQVYTIRKWFSGSSLLGY